MPRVIDLTGKSLLITGGTGSFGNAFIRNVLANHDVASIRVFRNASSRDVEEGVETMRSLSPVIVKVELCNFPRYS